MLLLNISCSDPVQWPVANTAALGPLLVLSNQPVPDRFVPAGKVAQFGPILKHVVEFPVVAVLPDEFPVAIPHGAVPFVFPEERALARHVPTLMSTPRGRCWLPRPKIRKR